ncbi:MAG: hypothetical protein AAF481_17340 [Acidobacteriota bacterium]
MIQKKQTTRKLHARVLELWPETVDLAGAYRTTGEGVFFPALARLMGELNFQYYEDEPFDAALWAFSKIVQREARRLSMMNEHTLKPGQLSFEEFESTLRADLDTDEWRPVLEDVAFSGNLDGSG